MLSRRRVAQAAGYSPFLGQVLESRSFRAWGSALPWAVAQHFRETEDFVTNTFVNFLEN